MRKITFAALTIAICWFAAYAAQAAELNVADKVKAGSGFSITTNGSGEATLYLAGPANALKRKVRLGEPINIAPEELRSAGQYIVALRAEGGTTSKAFFVISAQPADIAFLARPSRVPADKKDVITGVAFVFDNYKNLVLAPTPVKFELAVSGAKPVLRTVTAKEGIAWTHMNSGRSQGAAQFVADLPNANDARASVRRVVQQVAGDACNLHMKADLTAKNIIVQTDPVRDCTGNPVPDGTIVTFTEVDSTGRSTVDARIKKGIARAELPLSNNATISVAAGVVLGNELHVGPGTGAGGGK